MSQAVSLMVIKVFLCTVLSVQVKITSQTTTIAIMYAMLYTWNKALN